MNFTGAKELAGPGVQHFNWLYFKASGHSEVTFGT